MAWVTPTTVATGDVLTASKWNQDVQANGAALAPLFSGWTTYTPTVTQSTAVTVTTNYSKWIQVGRLVIWNFHLTASSGGSAGSILTISLPTAASATLRTLGSGMIYYNNTPRPYAGIWMANTTTTVALESDDTGNNYWGAIPSLQFAANNSSFLAGTLIYESAA